jgi:hypothetical protein
MLILHSQYPNFQTSSKNWLTVLMWCLKTMPTKRLLLVVRVLSTSYLSSSPLIVKFVHILPFPCLYFLHNHKQLLFIIAHILLCWLYLHVLILLKMHIRVEVYCFSWSEIVFLMSSLCLLECSAGSKDKLIPPIPPLTRCKTKKSWFGKGKGEPRSGNKSRSTQRKMPASNEAYNLPHLCVRINTLHYILSELDLVEKKIRFGWQKDPMSNNAPSLHPTAEPVDSNLYKARAVIKEGVDNLMEIAAYRVVFSDLRDVLWDGLYIGGVANARIDVVNEQLDMQLGIISESSNERLRNRVIGALMRACFEGYMLVLMAAGTSRAFTVSDANMLQEDLQSLKDVFKADGEGLPGDKVDREASLAEEIVSLFSLPSNELIQKFISANGSVKAGAKPTLPPTTGNWSISDPDTLLRVLCYRADDTASKFLKKNFRLPKNE